MKRQWRRAPIYGHRPLQERERGAPAARLLNLRLSLFTELLELGGAGQIQKLLFQRGRELQWQAQVGWPGGSAKTSALTLPSMPNSRRRWRCSRPAPQSPPLSRNASWISTLSRSGAGARGLKCQDPGSGFSSTMVPPGERAACTSPSARGRARERMPDTFAAFNRYVDDTLESDRITATAALRDVVDAVMRPELPFIAPATGRCA